MLQLSILDNMMLGRTYPVGVGGRIRWRAAADSVGSYLRTVGVEADARSPVGSLSLTERSAVAIARALSDTGQGRLLLVLDEPTAALPSDDVGRLLAAIGRLRAEGHGVLLVSHHLGEVLDIADRITVLRDGRVVASVRRAEVDQRRLTELIVGHSVVVPDAPARGENLSQSPQESPLRVRRLHGGRLRGLDFDVRSGEIVGVAGIGGSGRESRRLLRPEACRTKARSTSPDAGCSRVSRNAPLPPARWQYRVSAPGSACSPTLACGRT